jgi:hypothetical protein
VKRFIYLLPVFLVLLFSCSENPSEVTSKISSAPVVESSDVSNAELDGPSWEELEIMALEELGKDDPSVLHDRHFNFLHGTIRTRCNTEGHLIWGDPDCRPVAIAIVNTGRCPIRVDLKCGPDMVAHKFVHHGEHKILHGVGNHIFVNCLVHGHRCSARYAIIWL